MSPVSSHTSGRSPDLFESSRMSGEKGCLEASMYALHVCTRKMLRVLSVSAQLSSSYLPSVQGPFWQAQKGKEECEGLLLSGLDL
jgi:hypothetical protein